MEYQPEPTGGEIEVDPPKRLSESMIWAIQRAFFTRKGVGAWSEAIVPEHISSNPYMARVYGRLTKNFLRDCLQADLINPAEPVHIVELGGGSGRLAYHFLHHLLPQLQAPPFADLDVRYVLTDFHPGIIDFWQGHPRFQPLLRQGVLDFGVFDAVNRQSVRLIRSGERLGPGGGRNPLLLIANYFFDSIPADAFAVIDGRLHEHHLALYSSQEEPEPADPQIWERLEWEYSPRPAADAPYGQPELDRILGEYAAGLPDTTFLFPGEGIQCIRFWQQATEGPLLLLTADKGYADAAGLVAAEDPLPGLHGSFSFMVNYHAISRYVLGSDGLVLQPDHYQDNLHVLAYMLGERPNGAAETISTFNEAVNKGGPDDFYGLKSGLEGGEAQFTLPQLLNLIRLSGHDAFLFHELYPALAQQLLDLDPIWHADVTGMLQHVWDGFYAVGDETAVATCIRNLLAQMGYDATDFSW